MFNLGLVVLFAGGSSGLQAQSANPSGKWSGILFGDIYSVGRHHNPEFENKQGIWNRRFNLTYDHKFNPAWSGRFRTEFKDPGDFSSEHSIDPFVKDAWIRYTIHGHRITAGLIPTPTWEVIEDKMAYRPIEKSPIDLYRMGNSRDKGISIQGPLTSDGSFDYMVMLGDGSGTKSSVAGQSTIYGRLGYKPSPELYVDVYGDSWRKTGGARWQTLAVEGFYTSKQLKAGLSYITQRRERPGAASTRLHVLSVYGEVALSDRVSPYIRYDVLSDALADADKIDYYRMSKDGKPSFLNLGVRVTVHKNFELTPNVSFVNYRAVGAAPAPGGDTLYRLTFCFRF